MIMMIYGNLAEMMNMHNFFIKETNYIIINK
jgi:hypothetical protein